MILLQKLRGPWRITFDTNPDDCNLHCIMCEEHSYYNKRRNKRRLMEFRLIEKVIKNSIDFGLTEIIPSTMGEPLLYPRFENFVNLVKRNNLKINLTTNGTFPRLSVKNWGDLILPVASDVKISVNGATKETTEALMAGIDFKKQFSNISEFVRLRDRIAANGLNHPTVTFQVTYMEKNLEELPDLLKIAIKMDIDRFKGHHIWITHPELKNESLKRNRDSVKRWNDTVEKLRKIADEYQLMDGRKIRLENLYKLPYGNAYFTSSKSWFCPFLGREAWIAWDGTFNVCCAPDNLRKTLGYFGNVNESNLNDLWNGVNYNGLVRNWGNYNVCKNCNMRKPEKGLKRCLNEKRY